MTILNPRESYLAAEDTEPSSDLLDLLAFSLAIGSDLINTGHRGLDRTEVLVELALTRILAP